MRHLVIVACTLALAGFCLATWHLAVSAPKHDRSSVLADRAHRSASWDAPISESARMADRQWMDARRSAAMEVFAIWVSSGLAFLLGLVVVVGARGERRRRALGWVAMAAALCSGALTLVSPIL